MHYRTMLDSVCNLARNLARNLANNLARERAMNLDLKMIGPGFEPDN